MSIEPCLEKPLLIIEFDTKTLAAQGLSCADRIASFARLCDVDPVTLKVASTHCLLDQLGRHSVDTVFDSVVLIGHGNEDGIVMAPERGLATWRELTCWLKPLKPLRLAFISCKVGQVVAMTTMFDELEDLDEVFAPPLRMSHEQSLVIDALLPVLLDPDRGESYIRSVQAAATLLTRGVLMYWTRDGLADPFAEALANVKVQIVKTIWGRRGLSEPACE